jgi:catechol 2,3-dioxygenase-like lactoylglutathione lyase family enzyme
VTILGIDHVQVAAPPRCEAAARSFYGGLLGLDEISKPVELARRGGAWFRCGDRELHVGVAEDFSPARKAHPALAVDGENALRRLASDLEAAGAEVRWDDSLPEVPRFYVDDPWGNRLELLADAGV